MHAVRPLTGGRGHKADIRLRRYEMRAARDRLHLTLDVAIPTAAGDYAVVARRFDHALLRRDDIRIVEFPRPAHIGEHVVAAEMDDVDTLDRSDLLDVVKAFHRFDHAHQ